MVTSERWWKIVRIVRDALVIVLCYILDPVYCVLEYIYNRWIKEKRSHPYYDFLDPRSKDSVLTLPLEPVPGIIHQKATAAQTDCLLLTMLPKELRDMIWEECLGKKAFHLTMTWERFINDPVKLEGYICCSFEDIQHRMCLGFWRVQDDGCCYLNTVGPADGGKYHHIKILYTCRKIYSEAVQHLYKSNKFVAGPNTVEYLPYLMVPARFDSIRTLHIRYPMHYGQPMIDYPGSPELPDLVGSPFSEPTKKYCALWSALWVDAWGAIAKMKGLQDLRVRLLLGNDKDSTAWVLQREAMEAIMKVTQPSRFVLILPYGVAIDKLCGPVEALPCTVLIASTYADGFGNFDTPYELIHPH